MRKPVGSLKPLRSMPSGAALAAAAADALQGQSGHLAQLVSMFKLDAGPVRGHKMLALR